MKKIILTLGVVCLFQYTQAQELSKDIKSLETAASNDAKNEVKAEENKGIKTALTDLINGVKSASLSGGQTNAGLLSKLQAAKGASGYASVLSSLAGSIKPTDLSAEWAKVKTSFTQKASAAKSDGEVASLAKELVQNIKPGALTSGFNKTTLLDALSAIK